MTDKQQKVYDFLLRNPSESFSPTQIGMAHGKSYGSASSWCADPLKKLVDMGLVRKSDKSKYSLS